MLACALVLASASARAQQPNVGGTPEPPAPAPPPSAEPAPGYPPPQPYPPPGYGYPPPGYAYPAPPARPAPPPAEMPYDPNRPVPAGYHIDERVRRGPLIAGAIVIGVPYVIGLNTAAAAGFENHSYWLAIPVAGPFLTLATRNKVCEKQNKTTQENWDCLGDFFVGMLLVFDGIMQTTGGVLVGVGLGATKQVLVRDTARVRFGPRPVGTGCGFGAWGNF